MTPDHSQAGIRVITAQPPIIPSIDRLLRHPAGIALTARHGHAPVVAMLREAAGELRSGLQIPAGTAPEDFLLATAAARLDITLAPSLRRVFNLTGTMLHTNLGRAPLAAQAMEAIAQIGAHANTLEYDLLRGTRGDRDSHVEALLCRITGAEAATVVNNNAAAVMLVLAALARRREVIVSRGELVEIGGSFRVPEVMATAGAKLREVGTTNRVHLSDYAEAVGPGTALIMKVHPSNYRVEGFTATVPEPALAALADERAIPFVNDLGSGTLIDFRTLGLPHEPTVQEALAAGAHLVTFSGDKLLGGPQAGVIAGRADLVKRIKRHPMMRALRVDKLILSALEATLRLYADPARARSEIPALRLLARPLEDIEGIAAQLVPAVTQVLGAKIEVAVVPCQSQIGSGALPVDLLPSQALSLTPLAARGRAVERLASRFRDLPIPVIGRVHQGALLFDLRALESVEEFLAQLPLLAGE